MPFIKTEARYENTTMREIRDKNHNLIAYDIAPIDGYVLHNVTFDSYEYNPETKEQGRLISLGYSPGSCSVEVTYDFEANSSKIYAKKKDELQDDEVVY